jgi:hypothetical protein
MEMFEGIEAQQTSPQYKNDETPIHPEESYQLGRRLWASRSTKTFLLIILVA